jgi:arginine-tRNA-protein transferase
LARAASSWFLLGADMARQVKRLVEAPRACSYLPDEAASLEHRILVDVTPDELEALLVRGYRRFGPDYFRPACRACSQCVPTRVPTASFTPSKSQRRALRACARLDVSLGEPVVDDERRDLYARWHAFREEARGWDPSPLDDEGYTMSFAFPHPATRELAYRDPDTGALVGVALCDETPRVWSAIYFFYEPTWARRSIGVANILVQIQVARARGRPHVYLGYLVDACPSMQYKARFRPQERLVGWPRLDEEPRWVSAAPLGSSGLAPDPDRPPT